MRCAACRPGGPHGADCDGCGCRCRAVLGLDLFDGGDPDGPTVADQLGWVE